MPIVNSQTPNRVRSQNTANRRAKFTGMCMNCGNKVTFCGRPFTADVRCCKCKYINSFKASYQPVECWPMDKNGNRPFLS